MKDFLIQLIGVLLSTNAIHTYVFFGALAGIGYGVWIVSQPAAIVSVSVILMALVIYARTRGT